MSPDNKAEIIPNSPEKHYIEIAETDKEPQGLHTSGYSIMSQRKFPYGSFGIKNGKSSGPKTNLSFLVPFSVTTSKLPSPNTRRPVSAMDNKISQLSVEEIGERYWGK